MSRSTSTFLLMVALAVPKTALQAQDAATRYAPVLGEWEMTLETQRGSFTQLFVFTLEDDELTGTLSSQRGENDMSDVSFENGVLEFSVVRNFRGNSMTQSFSAKIDGDEMTGTMSGGRGGRGGGNREFTARRTST
jgi:hypothetical protein